MPYSSDEKDSQTRRIRMMGLVVLLFALAVIGALALFESAPQGVLPPATVLPTTILATTTVKPTATTTIPVHTNLIQNMTIAYSYTPPSQVVAGLQSLVGPANALYSLPNNSSYSVSVHSTYERTSHSDPYYYGNASAYGLGFMQGSPVIIAPYTVFSTPPSFVNSTTPAVVEVAVLLANTTMLANSSANATELNDNVYIDAVFPQNGTYSQAVKYHGINYTVNYTQYRFMLNGTPAGVTVGSPYADAFYYYRLGLLYKNYAVIVATYGAPGTYDTSYTYAIATHLLSELRSQAWANNDSA